MRDTVAPFANNRARALRKRQTEAEKRLWSLLRDRRLSGLKFRRQVPAGPYIVDFLCVEHRLIVEADGSQHFENTRDRARDIWLSEHGYKVLRFWNSDVLLNPASVKATIITSCGFPA